MGIFNFKSRKQKEAEILNKYQRMFAEAVSSNMTWNGEKFRGSLGLVKVFNSIDYWTLRQKSLELWTDSPYARGIIRRILRNEIFTGLVANSNPMASVLWPGKDEMEAQDLAVRYGDEITSQFNLYANNYELFDYRKELTSIYLLLRPYGLTDRVKKSIDDVTTPTQNSINEKCARIRGAFVGQFDNYMAKNYYVDGIRGEVKKISLPRNLVVWE